MKTTLCLPLALLAASLAHAEPATYDLDPTHTFPSFEADHMGLSKWRGKVNRNQGSVVLDKVAGTGSVEVIMEMDSLDFGLDIMNDKARSPELFDTARFPKAVYKGRLTGFAHGAPTKVEGELTLLGATRPVNLSILSFKCMPHPMLKRDWCGADALATFQRDQFGIDAGKDWGFDMGVTLRIQVEGVKRD